jgi:beta-glucosidase
MTTQLDPAKFPEDFLWGSSTSAHQVGDSLDNQWMAFERENAHRLAAAAGPTTDYGNGAPSPIWNDIAAQAKDPNNYLSNAGPEHWYRFEEDLDIMVELGLTAYRFGIEWSRVEPRPGQFDENAIEHYRQVIRACRARGIQPFVGLWHWTEPLWFTEQGSWESTNSPHLFARYANHIAQALGNEATFWVTINEPEVFALYGYIFGTWPPGKTWAIRSYFKVKHNLVKAHQAAYTSLKEANPASQIGAAINNVNYELAGGSSWLVASVARSFLDRELNRSFRDQIADTSDWLGLNYYMRYRVGWNFMKPLNQSSPENQSDLGWELDPAGHTAVLLELKKYGKPIYITESGLADRSDAKRAHYIRDSILAIQNARDLGVDVRGYLHWSFLDNFEWDKGWWPQFGLIGWDRQTKERTVKASAWEYAKIIKALKR